MYNIIHENKNKQLMFYYLYIDAYPQGFSTQCGENEVFTRCGSTCPTTCTSVKFQPCTLVSNAFSNKKGHTCEQLQRFR